MSRLIHQPDAGVLHRMQSDYRARRHFGVGARCGTPTSMARTPTTDPRCFDIEYLSCCKTKIARAALAVAPGTNATIQMEPMTSSHFRPCATSLEVVNTADPSLRSTVKVFGVTILGCPQTGIFTETPTAASTNFFLSTEWDPLARAGCSCPISWGCFSNVANSAPLSMTIRNDGPDTLDVVWAVYGDPLSVAPPCGCGVPYNEFPSVNGAGMSGASLANGSSAR